MSIRIMSLVWQNGPTEPHLRLLLLALADSANDEGVTWPSVATLSRKTVVQERGVQKNLRALEEGGWIVTTQRPGRSAYYTVMRGVLGDTPSQGTPLSRSTPTPVPQDTPGVSPRTPESSMNHQEPKTLARRSRARIAYTPDFEEFWSVYPRKVGKQQAMQEWARISNLNIDRQRIIAAAERYRDDPNREDQFTRHPSTWLHADGWLDEPMPARTNGRPTGNDIARGALALAERLDTAALRQIGSA